MWEELKNGNVLGTLIYCFFMILIKSLVGKKY